MFALFEEETQVDGRGFAWVMHVEGHDKSDCNKQIMEYMDNNYGSFDIEGTGVYRAFTNEYGETVHVDSVQYFDEQLQLIEALVSRTKIV
jgi:hypothetical protein